MDAHDQNCQVAKHSQTLKTKIESYAQLLEHNGVYVSRFFNSERETSANFKVAVTKVKNEYVETKQKWDGSVANIQGLIEIQSQVCSTLMGSRCSTMSIVSLASCQDYC